MLGDDARKSERRRDRDKVSAGETAAGQYAKRHAPEGRKAALAGERRADGGAWTKREAQRRKAGREERGPAPAARGSDTRAVKSARAVACGGRGTCGDGAGRERNRLAQTVTDQDNTAAGA